MKSKKKIIFILPYLNVNTTSSERFKSFIKAAEENPALSTEVITIDYGIKRSYFAGLSNSDVDYFHPQYHQSVKVNLNVIQRLGFACINQKRNILWRIFQLLHLIVYGKDIFYPQNIAIDLQSGNQSDGYVFSSGSHFSLFSTAHDLAEQLGYKLILDYRDPWTFGYNPIDGFRFVNFIKNFFGRSTEEQLLNKADLITTVSESLRSFFPAKYLQKIKIIANGSNFSPDDVTADIKFETFNIVYAGTIYSDQLKDEVFFRAMKEFVADKTTSRICLQFLGAAGNGQLKELIAKYNLTEVTTITPRLLKANLLPRLNQASVFLHLRYAGKSSVISSKQAEYLNFSKPILLPVSDEGDLAESILNNKAGYVCRNREEVLLVLNSLWESFKNGKSLKLNHSKELMDTISRDNIARKLVDTILHLT